MTGGRYAFHGSYYRGNIDSFSQHDEKRGEH